MEELKNITDKFNKSTIENIEDINPSQITALKDIIKRLKDDRNDAIDRKFEYPNLDKIRIKGYDDTKIFSVSASAYYENENGRAIGNRCHFKIGPRGAISIIDIDYNDDYKGKKTRAKKYPLIYGYNSDLYYLPVKDKN